MVPPDRGLAHEIVGGVLGVTPMFVSCEVLTASQSNVESSWSTLAVSVPMPQATRSG